LQNHVNRVECCADGACHASKRISVDTMIENIAYKVRERWFSDSGRRLRELRFAT
jgi:hypothetical protein